MGQLLGYFAPSKVLSSETMGPQFVVSGYSGIRWAFSPDQEALTFEP
jgi:hypothetical protein